MSDDIQALKRDFYRYHFGDLLMFLDNPSLNPGKDYTSYKIAAINERCNFQLYNGDNPPFMELQASHQRTVAAVEEFFDMMENAGTALQDVTHILKYLKDPAGAGTIADMDDLAEDRILRVICFHFWNLLERKPLNATEYQQKKYEATVFEYSDFSSNDPERITYSRMINGPIMALLTYRHGLFVPFLRVAKGIRNKSTHYGKFFNQAEGYLVYRYILFTYIATVLLIRKAQFPNAPCSTPVIKLFIDGSYNSIKLSKNKSELAPQSTQDGRTYFNVKWYQEYKLEIEGKSIEFTLTCNDWEPSASKVGDEIRTFSNDYQVDNDAHSASFHQAMDAFEKAVVELRDISRNTEDVPKIYGLIEKTIEQQESQSKSLEEISGSLNEISQALQKGQEERNKELERILGSQTKLFAEYMNFLNSDLKRPVTKIYNNTRIIKWLLILFFVILIAGGIWFYLSRLPSLSAAEWVEKGDQYFLSLKPKDNSNAVFLTIEQARSVSDQAGQAYRHAIKLYKDSLEEDSNNISANIALASLLMRGKGDYDIQMAKRCAKRAKNNKRGLGLYAYLLLLNGDDEQAHFIVGNYQINENSDPYLRLTKILLTLFGDKKSLKRQTKESIDKLIRDMEKISDSFPDIEPECRVGYTQCILDGIYYRDNQKNDVYLFEPNPLYACSILSDMSSINPVAFAMASQVFGSIGHKDRALIYNMIAYGCGLRQVSPSLFIQAASLLGRNQYVNDYLDSLSRNDHGELDTKLIHLLYRVNQEKGTEQDYQEAWELIETIKQEFPKQTVYESDTFNDIINIGIFLALKYGDVDKAAEWMASNEAFPDTSAVKDYILFSCYYFNKHLFPIETINKTQSDSLLISSYQKGYPNAIRSLIVKEIHPSIVIVPLGWENGLGDTSGIESMPDTIWQTNPDIATALAIYWMTKDNSNAYLKYLPYSRVDFKIFMEFNQFADANEHIVNENNYGLLCKLANRGIARAIQVNNTSLVQWFCANVTEAGMLMEKSMEMGWQYKGSYYYHQKYLIGDQITVEGYTYDFYLLTSPFDDYYQMSSSAQTDNQREFVDVEPIVIIDTIYHSRENTKRK